MKAFSVKTRKADDVQSCLGYHIFNLVRLTVLCHNCVYERLSVVSLVHHSDSPDHRWLWLFVPRWTAQLFCWMVMQVVTATDTTSLKSLTQFTLKHQRRIMTDCSVSTPSSTTCHKPFSTFFPTSVLEESNELGTRKYIALPLHIVISGKYFLLLTLCKGDAGY